MRQVSAFILSLANAISDDLREHVAPDKLQYEVELELEKQILAQLVTAIHQYSGVRSGFGADGTQANVKRKQVLRMMGYCSEMWVKTDEVKGALMSGELVNAETVEGIFS